MRINLLRRAACAATVIAANLIVTGCGSNFRPIATPVPVAGGAVTGTETVAILNQCPSGITCTEFEGRTSPSNVTAIDVSGDENVSNRGLQNQVGSVSGPAPGSLDSPIAWDAARTSLFTANTPTNSLSQVLVNPSSSTSRFAANVNTLTMPAGAAPISIAFEYFGSTYPQHYVVDSGNASGWGTCSAGGGLTAIKQSTTQIVGTACLGAGSDPVAAWIYKDQSKVFVADYANSLIYVVDASKMQVTTTLALPSGSHPFKFSQSANGVFVYVLNANSTLSIIDGGTNQLLGPFSTIAASDTTAGVLTNSPPVDIGLNTNFNDTIVNTQVNRIWILHADGAVSVWDATTPSNPMWLTTIPTITPAQLTAGAYPTNLALLRDGSWAYVGVGNTDHIVAIDTTLLATGAVTQNATTSITVGTHRTINETLTNDINPTPIAANVLVETTTPTVTSVGVSRQGASTTNTGASALLSKAYATTATSTIFYCYDENVTPTSCANLNPWSSGTTITALPPQPPAGQPLAPPFTFLAGTCTQPDPVNHPEQMSCPDLYNGTTIVTAATQLATPESPATPVNTVVKTIQAPFGDPNCDPSVNPDYTGAKNCPAMEPELVLGRN